ncbi:MAG TPA: hypothetical protein EYN67_14885 [Flavobacteriales bacterium]|nr:hypothetical protein [Flavobacteriales bacterium]
MSDQTKDFNEDFTEKYSASDLEIVDALILMALEDDKDSSKGNWESSLSREKHDALNYTYHISLNKIDDEDDMVELSFYTGVDVGCELVDYSLGGLSLADKPNMQRVLVDLKLDWSRIRSNVDPKIAQYMLDGSKADILEIYSKQGYDNYVTGGGTSKTNSHYKDKFDNYHNRGLFWTCVYEEQEFDRNIC